MSKNSLRLHKIVFLSLLLGSAMPAEAAIESKYNFNVTPEKLCSYLDLPDPSTYKPLVYPENPQYSCGTAYMYIERTGGVELDNNLAYYVIGTASKAEQLKLVLNMNQPEKSKHAHAALLKYAGQLLEKTLSQKIPVELKAAIISGQSKTALLNGHTLEVTKEEWNTGRGYNLTFIIK